MKVNFDTKLIHIDGKVLTYPTKEKDGEGKEIIVLHDLSLKYAATEGLMSIMESDRGANGEAKFKRYELATKINVVGEVEITPEEATLIKQRIGEAFGAAVVGPAYKLLNG